MSTLYYKVFEAMHAFQPFRLIYACMALIFVAIAAPAKNHASIVTSNSHEADSIVNTSPATHTALSDAVASAAEDPEYHGILFPHKSLSLALSHFTWGAELGSSIDMTGNDMSTIDVDVLLGYKNDYIKTLGIGAGIHRSVGRANNFIPVYLLFRSSFRKEPSLLFMHLKAGYSFNAINDGPTKGDVSASIGCGVNLALSRHFKSYIILAYAFRHFNKSHKSQINLDISNVSLAQISFGVNF